MQQEKEEMFEGVENRAARDPSHTAFLLCCGSIPKRITAEGAAERIPPLPWSSQCLTELNCKVGAVAYEKKKKVVGWCERACCERVVETALVSRVRRESPSTYLALERRSSLRWWLSVV